VLLPPGNAPRLLSLRSATSGKARTRGGVRCPSGFVQIPIALNDRGGQNVTSPAFNIHGSSNEPLVSNCQSPSERWPLRVHPHLVLLGLVLPVVLLPLGLSAQKADCPNGPALLSPSEPVYSDAMELKQTLESHGFEVRCVFPTHLSSIFEVAGDGGVMHSSVEGKLIFEPTTVTWMPFSCPSLRPLLISRSPNIVRAAAFVTPLAAHLGCGM
jgi:hypothetical protein